MREPKKESNVQNKKTKYPSNGGTACIWARPEMLAIIDELMQREYAPLEYQRLSTQGTLGETNLALVGAG